MVWYDKVVWYGMIRYAMVWQGHTGNGIVIGVI